VAHAQLRATQVGGARAHAKHTHAHALKQMHTDTQTDLECLQGHLHTQTELERLEGQAPTHINTHTG